MKKKILLAILSLFIIASSIIIGSNISSKENKDTKAEVLVANTVKNDIHKIAKEKRYAQDCKTCHFTEYPTKKDPGLINCPRAEMITVEHKAAEGPEIVILNELVDRYNPVVFSHKLHAEMSEMTGGCSSCHHYNTTGPVLACNTCHDPNRKREDISKPDLSAAYHRQCVNCHRQWMRETDCNHCHEPKSNGFEEKVNRLVNETKGRYHPEVEVPNKFLYETNYEKGKIVTFYHKEHTDLYKAPCITCHKEDNCMKCHDVKMKNNPNNNGSLHKIHKTFEEHHQPCTNCHKEDKCEKCHSDKEVLPFNHDATGWSLGKHHSKLACKECHADQIPIKKLNHNCTNCHKDFKPGKFDHKRTGLILSENHKDLECESCHPNSMFNKVDKCTECHEDKKYPKDLPGKKIK